MKTTYSKPSSDIQKENTKRLADETEAFEKQQRTYRKLKTAANRTHCILCAKKLQGEAFNHRGLPFIICSTCEHVELALIPPPNYITESEFHTVYPKLNTKDYEDRKKRIYWPKLTWMVQALHHIGYSSADLRSKSWFEFGVGAGYFLSTLQDFRIKNFAGCDQDPKLVEIASDWVKKAQVVCENKKISDSIAHYQADIYVAFYVLEHAEDLNAFLRELNQKPKGTIFVFAVPVFGFATVLDSVFEKNFARNLDGVLHTQLYTDASIQYAMKLADYDIKAEWIFGQDIDDLWRYLRLNIKGKYPKSMEEKTAKIFGALSDNMQSLVDKSRFSDQRHIVAIKR